MEAGTILILRCADPRAHIFEYDIRTASPALASSGWSSQGDTLQDTAKCILHCGLAACPSASLPWELVDDTIVTATAKTRGGAVVCAKTTRVFSVSHDNKSRACPAAQLKASPAGLQGEPKPQNANTWREEGKTSADSTRTISETMRRATALNKHLLHGPDDEKFFVTSMVEDGLIPASCRFDSDGIFSC